MFNKALKKNLNLQLVDQNDFILKNICISFLNRILLINYIYIYHKINNKLLFLRYFFGLVTV